MVFSNLVFLFVFLPTVLVTIYLIRPELRNILLLVFSLFFYAWGEPTYIFLMILSIAINYLFGLMIDKFEHHQELKKVYFSLSRF